MRLSIHVQLDYSFPAPTDILLQIEAALIPEQYVEQAHISLPSCEHFARVPAHDCVGERLWLRTPPQLIVGYEAIVSIHRHIGDIASLASIPPHQLPGETVQYLLPSLYCPSDQFRDFVEAEFAGLSDGALIAAMRDWIEQHIRYSPGFSDVRTTAKESFIGRKGICRDYAHLLITLARAASIPARIASVYAPDLTPPDFHAVAEIFLGGSWHLVDATGMAQEQDMAKIGIGRDAADIAFLTAFGDTSMNSQSVSVVQIAP